MATRDNLQPLNTADAAEQKEALSLLGDAIDSVATVATEARDGITSASAVLDGLVQTVAGLGRGQLVVGLLALATLGVVVYGQMTGLSAGELNAALAAQTKGVNDHTDGEFAGAVKVLVTNTEKYATATVKELKDSQLILGKSLGQEFRDRGKEYAEATVEAIAGVVKGQAEATRKEHKKAIAGLRWQLKKVVEATAARPPKQVDYRAVEVVTDTGRHNIVFRTTPNP